MTGNKMNSELVAKVDHLQMSRNVINEVGKIFTA